MVRIAQFEKVSWEQYAKDFLSEFPNENINGEELTSLKATYELICTPYRSTEGSAGYDFEAPFEFELKQGESIKIPTGIRCKIDEGWVLMLYPRSSVGFKYGIQYMNTIPVIDSDYYYSDNEGHIWIKFVNRGDKIWHVNADDKIAQGVFVPYGITYDDNVDIERNGGIGSTGK